MEDWRRSPKLADIDALRAPNHHKKDAEAVARHLHPDPFLPSRLHTRQQECLAKKMAEAGPE